VIISNQFRDADLLKNTSRGEEQNAWIGFTLESKNPLCNAQGLGSLITLSLEEQSGTRTIYKELKLANGFSAQNEIRAHFGLGSHQGPLKVRVNWCQKIQRDYEFRDLNRYEKLVLP